MFDILYIVKTREGGQTHPLTLGEMRGLGCVHWVL